LAFFTAALAAATWWAAEEFGTAEPLLDLRLLRNRSVGAANLATAALGWGRFSAFLVLPDLVQAHPRRSGVGLGGGPLAVGLFMLPDAGGQMVAALVASALAARLGGRRVFAGGLVVLGAGAALLAATTTSPAEVVVGALLAGTGSGLSVQTASTVTTQGIAADLTAVSSSLNSTIRRFAGGVGSQVSIALLAAVGAGAAGVPGRTAFAVAFALAAALCLAGAFSALRGASQLAGAGGG
jgi:predicted MFS family arabinose efflux permease